MQTKLLGAAALALLASDNGFHVDASAVQIESPRHNSIGGNGFLALPVGTVPRPPSKPNANNKRASGAFEDQLGNTGYFYTTNVTFGTPGQPVTVFVDTGSDVLWVNPDCSKTRAKAQHKECLSYGKYDPEKSTTPPDGPGEVETLNYGDVTDPDTLTFAKVRYYRDTIELGGAKIRNQTFGVATSSKGVYAGLLGLGPDLQNGFERDAPLSSMASQGVIASRVFSLDLRHLDDATGAVIYGGLDKSKFVGALEKRPMVRGPQDEYRLALKLTTVGVTLGSSPQSFHVAGSDATVLLDSGATLSRLNSAVGLPILKALGAQDDGQGLYSVPCSMAKSQGSIDFGFGNKTIRVSLRDFVLKSQDACYAGMVLTEGLQILGESVLHAGYFVFDWDNEAIHVAQAANCGHNDIVAVSSGPNAVPQVSGNCKESDATATGSTQPSRTIQGSSPTKASTEPTGTAATTTSASKGAGSRPTALTGALVVVGALAFI